MTKTTTKSSKIAGLPGGKRSSDGGAVPISQEGRAPDARRARASGARAATVAADGGSDKDTDGKANRRALKAGAGGQARTPTGPREEEAVGAQGRRGAPYGVEEASWARGGKKDASEGLEEAAYAAATATKTHRHAVQAVAPQVANRRANEPQVSGPSFAALFEKNDEEPGPRGSAADFFGGQVNAGTADHPPFGRAADHHANDPQVSGLPFAARFTADLQMSPVFHAAARHWIAGIALAFVGVVLNRIAAPAFTGTPHILLAASGQILGAGGLLVIALGIRRRIKNSTTASADEISAPR